MRKAFTLIELMIVVAIIAVIAAIAIPNLVASKIASNETAAVACMRAFLGAQNQFHRTDFYGQGFLVYANNGSTGQGGLGFADLYEVGGPGSGGTVLKMIDLAFANASTTGNNIPRAGFLYDDITAGTAGAFDYSIDCGLGAAYKEWGRSGRNIYVIDVTGVVYQKPGVAADSGSPLTTYPDTTVIGGGWIPVGSD